MVGVGRAGFMFILIPRERVSSWSTCVKDEAAPELSDKALPDWLAVSALVAGNGMAAPMQVFTIRGLDELQRTFDSIFVIRNNC